MLSFPNPVINTSKDCMIDVYRNNSSAVEGVTKQTQTLCKLVPLSALLGGLPYILRHVPVCQSAMQVFLTNTDNVLFYLANCQDDNFFFLKQPYFNRQLLSSITASIFLFLRFNLKQLIRVYIYKRFHF